MVLTKKVNKTPYELWIPIEKIGYYFYFPPENKIVVARYDEFLEKTLLSKKVSGRAVELEEIQDEDASPFENSGELPMEAEGFEPSQKEVIPVCRSIRTHRAPERLCLNVKVDEHSLGDFKESTNYKAIMLDSESDKWLDAMNAKIQSMKENQVWRLVDLPPNDYYCDDGFETDRDDTKSNTGYVFILNRGLGIVPTINEPIKMFCDNSAALLIANEPSVQKELRVNCYCDARFKTDRDDTKSQTGYVFILNGGVVNLRFKLDTSSGKDVVSDDVSDGEDEIWVTREKLNVQALCGVSVLLELLCRDYSNTITNTSYDSDPETKKEDDEMIFLERES
uniref:Retrotransposon protein, putative, Ty1-copia subclass n=1 Tax=Tanacetum cinerariifolium TaxID=118510 RepID=A0A6L2M5G2_TANCI|nr:retrotransposon protein, putative, Ty1-copia subclass [Tanacetum cinerariifolium]